MSETAAPQGGWLKRLRAGLGKSSQRLGGALSQLLTQRRLDKAALDRLEELLITADLGVQTAAEIRDQLSASRFDQEVSEAEIKAALVELIVPLLEPVSQPFVLGSAKPHVALIVGVNGAGKTTSIAKLAQAQRDAGKSVMLAAGDTFRAAAIEQLSIWGERLGLPVVARAPGADPAALAYEALAAAQAAGTDLLLMDTAGRLHTKSDLMAELQKIIRVLRKLDPEAPQSCLLVLDATTGQNALSQVRAFSEQVEVSGLLVTKLDGSAKGGMVVALAKEFGLPIHAVGVGERATDMQPFEPRSFAEALVGLGE